VVAKCLIKDPPYLQTFEIKNLHGVYIIELSNETSEGRARFLCFISCYLRSTELCTVFSELQMMEILIFYPFAYLTLLVLFCIHTDKSKHDPCFLMPNPSLPIILFYFQLYHFAILILETKLFIPFPISYVCFVCCKLRWCKSHCLCPFPFKCDLFSLFLQNIFAHVLIIFRSLFPQI